MSKRVTVSLLILAVLSPVAGCSPEPPAVLSPLPVPPPPITPEIQQTGTVVGRVLWSAEVQPKNPQPSYLFFEETTTKQVSAVALNPGQTTYIAPLPAGSYYAYSWLPGFVERVAFAAGGEEGSGGPSLQAVEVLSGARTEGVDLRGRIPAAQQPIALLGALIDGTGGPPLADAVVVIQDGRVVAAGSASAVEVPVAARVFGLRGATILPGLINAHVHNAFDEANLRRWAQAGVTTVRDLGAPVHLESFATRDALNTDPQYARIVAAGPLVTVPGGYPIAGNNFPSLAVDSPQDARSKVGELIDQRADVIKITITFGGAPTLSLEEARAIVETAHSRGIPVSAHVTTAAAMDRALQASVDDMAHVATDPVSEDAIARMVEQGNCWVPTLAALRGRGIDNVRRFVAAGGRVAVGNDAGYIEGLDIGSPLDEITWLQKAGVTPMGVIVAATRDAAHVCRLAGVLGTLEAGKFADVVVVGGDPLRDLEALQDVLLVIHGGVIVREDRRVTCTYGCDLCRSFPAVGVPEGYSAQSVARTGGSSDCGEDLKG